MRDPNRIPRILGKLQKLWQTYPDQRISQLFDNVAVFDGFSGAGALFNLEDEKFEKLVDDILVKGWLRGSCTL